MTNIFDQDLDPNSANFTALSPVSFVERSAEIFPSSKSTSALSPPKPSTAAKKYKTSGQKWRTDGGTLQSFHQQKAQTSKRIRLFIGLWPATAYNHDTESWGKSIHWPCIQQQSVFYGSWQHNYYCYQRQAGRANEWSILQVSMVEGGTLQFKIDFRSADVSVKATLIHETLQQMEMNNWPSQ